MMLDAAARQLLRALARESLQESVRLGAPAPFPRRDFPAHLCVTRSSFVTLQCGGQLRGCCGRLEADRALAEDVWENAFASGFRDPRFEPLGARELPLLDIEISILSPLERLDVHDTAQLLAALTPHRDGLLLVRGNEQVTFIPRVWDSISDAATFVRHLREKAGWPSNSWEPELEVWRFQAESF